MSNNENWQSAYICRVNNLSTRPGMIEDDHCALKQCSAPFPQIIVIQII